MKRGGAALLNHIVHETDETEQEISRPAGHNLNAISGDIKDLTAVLLSDIGL